MSFDLAAFREHFPEFADDSIYSDAMVEFWAGIADKRLNTTRWDTLLDHGLELFTAHMVSLASENIADGLAGAPPGGGAGIMASQSAGGVSVSYDTSSVAMQDGGDYNQTVYGRQFLKLARIVGIGGAQIS